MKQRRNKRLAPELAPLTPDPSAQKTAQPSPDAQRVKELTRENANLRHDVDYLRALLNAERRRHGRLESALSKYTEGLESQLKNQTVAVQGLKDALLQNLASHLVEPQR